ncbi:hypothetical protein [Cellulomonas sp. Leaf334]|uniref:hypothetical protein n=1 Tax=Cellulomonas sp. Leaf334 TaxID=1736339 RepID=UPI0006FD0453|nr:hypothetical protein [Cellulomonas sp. Leaf334]KQR17393.1 hypothetical protein ASF78_08920 [Cellulomonas sp. Leaf334]
MRTYDQPRTPAAGAPGRANHARRTPEPFLHVLQRTAGNRAVGEYLQHPPTRSADAVVEVEDEPESEGAEGIFASTATHGLGSPAAASGGAVLAGLDGFEALAGPSVGSAADIMGGGSAPNGMRIGLTSAPDGYKAPQFEFGTVAAMGPTAADPPTFTCTPTWKQHVDEGSNVCWYLPAGKHKSITQRGGKDVYITLSAAMSTLDERAEREHADDIKQARDISIQEAETLLTLHVIGKTFPAAATATAAQQHVLDAITASLTHPGLGNDQSTWAATYDRLFMKTGVRDVKKWHNFGETGPPVVTATQIVHTVAAGSTSIGTTSSAALIVY